MASSKLPLKDHLKAEPDVLPDFPLTLLIGDFRIAVEKISKTFSWNSRKKTAKGVSGTGWIRFECGGLTQLSVGPKPAAGYFRIKTYFKVVSFVSNIQTEIQLSDARLIKPDAEIGENIELQVDLPHQEFQDLIRTEHGIIPQLIEKKGTYLVKFENVTVKIIERRRVGRIIKGNAVFPALQRARPIQLILDDFTATIDSLILSPTKALAHIILQLPKSIASDQSCKPATLDLGKTEITPDCQFYVEKSDAPFGPWIIGETGMIASGIGYTADFSSLFSPQSMIPSWKGVVLKKGEASGERISPETSNTGFINGKYGFKNALVTHKGMKTEFKLTQKHTFHTLIPLNYAIDIENCTLQIAESRIVQGLIGQGHISFPTEAIIEQPTRNAAKATFTCLTIQEDLDIAGEVDFENSRNAWGELTHVGNEVIVWSAEMEKGYLYLPSWTQTVYTPDTGTTFRTLAIPYQLSDAIAYLESEQVTGVTVLSPRLIEIYSPDRPNGAANPIRPPSVKGWLRIGNRGVDGELFILDTGGKQELGNTQRFGYVGRTPFDTNLGAGKEKMYLLGQFITSAVYDSGLRGIVTLQQPCNMQLDFWDMEISSTANLVGGNITLPPGGVCLDYWRLQLVPTGNQSEAGVISVRTGRLIFTAAGIDEPIHFTEPFRLTWGEILADGNLGELFFDYNNYGQRFDGFQFSPHHLNLSKYTGDPVDAYLSACGTLSFNFFGQCYINIRDARYDANLNPPHSGRYVTVPTQVEAVCQPTDLHLHGEWNNQLAVFDFPNAKMKYNEVIQEGFIGTGTAQVSFIQSNDLSAAIEMHKDLTDIRLSSTATHDLDFGLFSRLGGMSGLYGCVRIEGPTLKQFALNGNLEASVTAGMGILAPKAGSTVDVLLSITPTTCTFMASGDILLAVGGASVDISGYVSLRIDYERHSAEGEFYGIVDCSSVLGGLEGTGQVTWHIDPTIQFLQGRITMKICGWTGAGGFEGGLFIGRNVPREKAWVLLYTGSEHFGVSQNMLPSTLTGLYAYGLSSLSINFGFISGGCELFAGMGAFSETPPGLSSSWAGILGLPYVVGSCGIHIWGEILWGVVSASAWASLDLRGPVPIYFEGEVGLEGCILWVLCASIEITVGFNSGGFYAEM